MFIAIRKRLEDREEGFTLIELLVVVIIIGILAAIAIPVFLNQRERAWAGAVESDLRNAAVQMETAFTQDDEYPLAADTDGAAAGQLFFDSQLPSDGVTITNATVAADAGTEFCLEGTHENLENNGAAIEFSYNSALGGLQAEGTGC